MSNENTEQKPSRLAWLKQEISAASKGIKILVGSETHEQVGTGIMAGSGWAVLDGLLDGDLFQTAIGGIGLSAGAVLRWWPGLVGLQDKGVMLEPPKVDLAELDEQQLAELADQLGISTHDAVQARNLVLLPDDELAKAIEEKYGHLLRSAATGGTVSKADKKVLQAIRLFGEAARRQAAAK
jgi:hypothetical protein